MSRPKYTPGPLQVEGVSDAVRIFVRLQKHSGKGTSKVILARLNPPQLPEAETWANAMLFRAAPELLEALTAALPQIQPCSSANCNIGGHKDCAWGLVRAAIAKAEGK